MVIGVLHRRAAVPARGVVLVDVLVGAVLLGVSLTTLVGLSAASIGAQTRGERLATAAMLLDEQLATVLMRGPDDYERRYDTEGRIDPPFDEYSYAITISGGGAGEPYVVEAVVSWMSGGRVRSVSAQTLMAPRLGDDPDPERRPEEAINRYE